MKEMSTNISNIDTGKRGIIVIGEETYPGVTSCNWQAQIPNIAEFKKVVLNMTVVVEDTLPSSDWNRLKELIKKLIASDGEVYYIINKNSFLRWEATFPELSVIEGNTIKSQYKELNPYFNLISPWKFIFRGYTDRHLHDHSYEIICENSYGDALAIRHNNRYYLPIPSKATVQEGVNILLRDVFQILPQKTEVPNWLEQILLPEEKNVLTRIRTLDDQISDLKDRKKDFLLQL